jgi:eukaryotic-like serine/threonine-protein kinase
MMSSSPTDRYRRIDAVFDALLDLPPDEQMAYLDRAASDDPELHEEVLRLLQAHRRSEGFLEAPVAPMARALLDAPGLRAVGSAPDRIGPWRIVRAIGQGGMGIVLLGERADGQFEQRAAIKIIQYGPPGLVRRFLEERRILALLEHPGIARLIEGGLTPGGLPYYAMELVDGAHIDRYCDDHDLSVDSRLDLLAQVCDAVSYAHQHLIIHRDLKPSNILVTPAGRAKLLDFGIAKLLSGATGADRTDTKLPAMTPEFAAPEQVRGEPVSTATDVYALGVLLYLLLTGQHPYDVEDKPLAELTRIICEQEPAKPSTRAPEPRRRRLRGDLDLVVLAALHKDPKRRYQSPAALAEDLRRFRDGRPILARPDSLAYRGRKFVRRNRAAVALAAATAVALVGATAFSLVQMQDARAQRNAAVRAARRAVAMSELQGVLAGDARGPDGQPLSTADRIALAERLLVRQFRGEPWLVTDVMIDLSERFSESGDLQAQRRMLARARSIAHQANLPSELAHADCERATNFWYDDKIDSARADLVEARAALGRFSGRIGPEVEATCAEAEGELLQAEGRADSGIVLLRRALALTEADSNAMRTLTLTYNIAELLRQGRRTREAVPYVRRVLAGLEAAGYGDTEKVPNAVSLLWLSLMELGEFVALDSSMREFVREHEAVHGVARVPTAIAFLYGYVKLRLGELDSADLWLGRAARDTTQHQRTLVDYLPGAVSQLRLDQGRVAEAREAIARLPDDRRSLRATAAMLRARLRRLEGDSAGASALLERELGVLLTDGHQALTWFALPLATAGEWRLARGDARGADSLARLARVVAAVDSIALTRSGLVGRAELLRARALRAQRDLPGARQAAARATIALGNGYGEGNALTRVARLLVDSLAR